MARALTKCPSCGEPVSQFAAGCAICGEDLEAARAQLAAHRGSAWGALDSVREAIPRLRFSPEVGRLALAALLALAAPLFGLLLAAMFAWQAHKEGRTWTRSGMLAIAVGAAVLMVVPVGIWGRFIAGL